MTDTTVEAAAGRVRRFLDERARPTVFAPQGFLPVDFLGEITRTGDRLLVSDLRTVLEALDAATKPVSDLGVCSDAATPVAPPPCENHREVQHRDRRPPWCDQCGWRHGVPAQPPAKIGHTPEQRAEFLERP